MPRTTDIANQISLSYRYNDVCSKAEAAHQVEEVACQEWAERLLNCTNVPANGNEGSIGVARYMLLGSVC
jgi:hypothetical protein